MPDSVAHGALIRFYILISSGFLPIHLAAESGNQNLVQYFLECGVAADVTTDDGETILHMAADGGHLQLVKFLVEELKMDVKIKTFSSGWCN